MHRGAEPLSISGPDQPHAFDNLPTMRRPAHADVQCGNCRGHGAWNETLYPDSFRCVLAICAECDGTGWKSADGSRTVPDIVMVDGSPAWILRRIPPPPVLVATRPAPGEEDARPSRTTACGMLEAA